MKYYFYKIREKYLNILFPPEITEYIMTKLVPYPKNINSMIKYRSIYHPTINNNKSRVLCHNNYLMQQCSICSHLRIMVFSNKFKYIEYPDCNCKIK